MYKAQTSFWSYRDHLIELFSIEGYPDEIVSDNGPPFNSKVCAKFLSGLGIKHATSSPGYPLSNGFIERHIQMVKNMLSKSSNTQSFQEVLADLRTTRIGTDLPSPAEILHGRNLTTKAQAEIDINAIRSLLQERQLKMMLAHDSSRRAKKAKPLVVGERCYVLGPNNKWIDAFVTGTKDSGRSYDTQVEATGGNLTSDQEALISLRFMLLSYSGTRSFQELLIEMHLRSKTRSFQDSWLIRIAKRRSFQENLNEISNQQIHLRS